MTITTSSPGYLHLMTFLRSLGATETDLTNLVQPGQVFTIAVLADRRVSITYRVRDATSEYSYRTEGTKP